MNLLVIRPRLAGLLLGILALPVTSGFGDEDRREFELASDLLRAGDTTWCESSAELRWPVGHDAIRVRYDHVLIQEQYQPDTADFFGHPEQLSEQCPGGRATWEHRWDGSWRTTVEAGGHDGFPEYQSLWRAEYFRQQYEGLPNYTRPNPHGLDARLAVEREFTTRRLWLRADLGWRVDTVVPNYEIVDLGSLARGRERFETLSGHVELEGVPTRSLRVAGGLRLQSVTDHEPRGGAHLGVAWVAGDHWVIRTDTAVTLEAPGFHAWSEELGAEWDHDNRWFLGLTGRIYTDNGASSPASGWEQAAPALTTTALELRLRYVGERVSVLAAAGPFRTDHDTPDPALRLFSGLYRDRDWLSARVALSFGF